MTNKDVLKKMFGIDLDQTNLKITCGMLECARCPHQYDVNCEPWTGHKT